MSTRSRIGIQNDDGSIESIYCHCDGYLDGVGKVLDKHYKSQDKVRAMIAEGDMSRIKPEIGSKHGYDSRDSACIFYARDRCEDGVEAQRSLSSSRDEFLELSNQTGAVCAYLMADGAWLVFARYGKERAWVPLADALASQEDDD